MKSVLIGLSFLLLVGCGSGRTFDLDLLSGKVEMGMTEFKVTLAIGAPTRIDIKGNQRTLTYDGKTGGALVVTLVEDRVIDIQRRN